MIQNMDIDYGCLDLDSVPVGVPQMESTPENFHSWLQKSGCNRYSKYILLKSDFQAKNDAQDRRPETFFELKYTNIKL